ncbi:MAG: hypothetical protein PHZ02_12155 [Desulfocapsaceae bacterium]|nr:hypothetical protein [Desulfocapsaceae bacterium]
MIVSLKPCCFDGEPGVSFDAEISRQLMNTSGGGTSETSTIAEKYEKITPTFYYILFAQPVGICRTAYE